MANKERGEKALVIGDRTFIARVTTNACCELEDFAAGKNWDQVRIGAADGNRKDFRLFFWTVLRDRHPDVATMKAPCLTTIGELLDEAGGVDSVVLTNWVTEFVKLNLERGAGVTEQEPSKGAPPGQDPPGAQAETGGVDSALTLVSSV